MLALLLAGVMSISLFSGSVLAAEGAEPAEAQDIYKFDNVTYVNLGNKTFSNEENPQAQIEEYYLAMLNTVLNKNTDLGEYSSYSIADLWIGLGYEIVKKLNSSNHAYQKNVISYVSSSEAAGLDAFGPAVMYGYSPNDLPESGGTGSFEDIEMGGETFAFTYYKDRLRVANNYSDMVKKVMHVGANKIKTVIGVDGANIPVEEIAGAFS